MKRKPDNEIDNIHLLPTADADEVRIRSGYTRRRRHPGLQMLARLAIVAAVLWVVFLLWQNWEHIAPEAMLDWAETQFGEGDAGDGYPFAIDGNTVVGMGQVKNHLAVLTDSSLQFLNSTAGRVVNRPHTLSDPLLKTAGRYAMLAEIGGSRVQLETRRETALKLELDNRKIYTADLTTNGIVAVATDSASQSYVCGIQVYNSRGKLIYEYKSSKYLITNLSLSPNGRGLAAIGAAAEGGALKSVLLLFDLSEDTPTEHVGTDLLLYDVTYFGSGTVLAVGDNECWAVDTDGNRTVFSLEGMELLGYAASSQTAGLVLRQSGSAGSGVVWMMDDNAAVTRKYQFVGTFRHVSCLEERVLVLTDSTLFALSETVADVQVNTPSDSLMAAEYRGDLMVLTLSKLRKVLED